MRKLTIIEHISLDGIVQAPGGPGEDRDGGFAHGGWAAPHFDPAVGQAIDAAMGATFDLVLGRHTYDIFAGYWPKAAPSPTADSLNRARKYVATHRPESLAWGPAEALGADIAAGVAAAKAADGPDLVLWGSSSVTPVLLDRELADEILLLVFPVLLGGGKRFFTDVVGPRGLKLVSSTAAASGVVASTYRPDGPLRTGSMDEIE